MMRTFDEIRARHDANHMSIPVDDDNMSHPGGAKQSPNEPGIRIRTNGRSRSVDIGPNVDDRIFSKGGDWGKIADAREVRKKISCVGGPDFELHWTWFCATPPIFLLIFRVPSMQRGRWQACRHENHAELAARDDSLIRGSIVVDDREGMVRC